MSCDKTNAEFRTEYGRNEFEKQRAMPSREWKEYFTKEWDKICKTLGAQRKIEIVEAK